jgi:hypothetical protein
MCQVATVNEHSDDSGYGVRLAGEVLYVADFNAGLQIVDVANPRAPMPLARYDVPGCGTPMDVIVAGNLAYVSYSAGGLVILDVTDPRNPIKLSSIRETGLYRTVVLSEGYAYAASQLAGLDVLDISSPYEPSFITHIETEDGATGVAVFGKTALVSTGLGRGVAKVLLFDAQDPRRPVLVGMYESPTSIIRGLDVSNDHAFVACYQKGLVILDIADPSTPQITGIFDAFGSCNDVLVVGNRLFLTSMGQKKAFLFDITTPTKPDLLAEVHVPGAGSLALEGDLLAVGTRYAGVYLFKMTLE